MKEKNESIIDVAFAVIKGDYGNGNIRRQKLKTDGHDFKTVENEIINIYRLAHLTVMGEMGNTVKEKREKLGSYYDVVSYVIGCYF